MDILYLQFEYFFSNWGRGRVMEEERDISKEYCECSHSRIDIMDFTAVKPLFAIKSL